MGKKASRNIFINFMRFLLLSSFIIFIISCAQEKEPAKETAEKTAVEAIKESTSDFITLYPGVYTEKEKALAEKWLSDIKAINERGPIDIQALINGTLPEDTPGVGPAIKVTETMVRYFNGMRDPENAVLNDAEYARKLGYKDIMAFPTFAAHDDTFLEAYPPAARDTLLVADLIHNITFYKPIYPGDTVYLIINSRHVKDLTPTEGSIYRSLALVNNGSIYNQEGEKVIDVQYTVEENVKIYKEGLAPENPTRADYWEEWKGMERLTRGESDPTETYYYTDEDWEFIKDIWSKEKRQGAEPLYWEDVNIGDQPAWTLDGPLDAGPAVTTPWGMGLGGNRTLKNEVLDPEIFKTMVRHPEDGIYRLPNLEDYIPPIPAEARTGMALGEVGQMDAELSANEDEGVGFTVGGATMLNFTRRDYAMRHIHNWMGDHGWLYNIRWGALFSKQMAATAYGEPHPAVNPDAVTFIDKVPEEIVEATHVSGGHGTAFIITKSYVYNKFVRDGEYFVDLIWWVDRYPSGKNWGTGGATIKLPSKMAR